MTTAVVTLDRNLREHVGGGDTGVLCLKTVVGAHRAPHLPPADQAGRACAYSEELLGFSLILSQERCINMMALALALWWRLDPYCPPGASASFVMRRNQPALRNAQNAFGSDCCAKTYVAHSNERFLSHGNHISQSGSDVSSPSSAINAAA